MIFTKRKDIERYLGLNKNLDTAIQHLLSADLTALTKGRNEVDGDQVFINRADYQTVAPEKAGWEGHAVYADMHLLLSGRERIGVANAETLNVVTRKPEADYIGYEGPVELWFSMTPEDVLILYPGEVHKVSVMDTESTQVEKVCFKCKV